MGLAEAVACFVDGMSGMAQLDSRLVYTAAHVMRVLESMSLAVPEEVRLAGFDDVKYPSLLPVPLTTIHQPCQKLGAAAISAMVERLRHPGLPARDILLNFKLVVRASSGGAVAG